MTTIEIIVPLKVKSATKCKIVAGYMLQLNDLGCPYFIEVYITVGLQITICMIDSDAKHNIC